MGFGQDPEQLRTYYNFLQMSLCVPAKDVGKKNRLPGFVTNEVMLY